MALLVPTVRINGNTNFLSAEQQIFEFRDFSKDIEDKKMEYERNKEIEMTMMVEEEVPVEVVEEMVLYPHYNPYNLRELSNLSIEQVYQALDGTALVTLADAFYWYEQEYQVNMFFMMGKTAQESGYGTSYLARNNNNLGGYKSSSGEYSYFSDWGECLQELFRLIDEDYLSEYGRYHNGYDIWSVNSLYCPNDGYFWSEQINKIAHELMNKVW